jgi:hypothetical protein
VVACVIATRLVVTTVVIEVATESTARLALNRAEQLLAGLAVIATRVDRSVAVRLVATATLTDRTVAAPFVASATLADRTATRLSLTAYRPMLF